MSSNPNNSDETVFIPCEICDEPVAMENYTEHTNACNSARFIEFHGVSLDELLNPVMHPVPHMVDFADNLASEDEMSEPENELGAEDELEEHSEEDEIGSEDEGLIASQPQPNVRIVPMAELIRALMGADADPDEIMALQAPQQAQVPMQHEPPSIDNLMNRLQNLLTAAMLGQQQAGGLANLEDVAVGLRPEQQSYCLTAKTLTEPATCNICCEDNLTQMTTLICGHELCSPCATRHFAGNVKCPFCNQDLRDIINSAITDSATTDN